jgi:hypothetical protein
MSNLDTINNCVFCNGNHCTRTCPTEMKLTSYLKTTIGIIMENHFSRNFSCPGCNLNTLKVLGNNKPSLDIICTNCSKKIEVKSKCLSVNRLPTDIICSGGNYDEFIFNINNIDLDLIVIIYGVNRREKEIYIRKILYAPNNLLSNPNIINIKKRNNSTLSNIFIKNTKKLRNIIIETPKIICFKNLFNQLLF